MCSHGASVFTLRRALPSHCVSLRHGSPMLLIAPSTCAQFVDSPSEQLACGVKRETQNSMT
jgi:hypothetical protein